MIEPQPRPNPPAASPSRRMWPSRRRWCGDHGEGVISAAIAVLVMAALGALMWVGFRSLWEDTEANTRDRVAEIGE